MKIKFLILPFLFAALLAISCAGINVVDLNKDAIKPSNVIITEQRDLTGFSGIDIRTFGKVMLSQGERESVSITGSDNIVSVIQTSVRDGILVFETDENINITGLNEENVLTFSIVVKDLSSLTISGAADVQMDNLSTSSLKVSMSGAGQFVLDQLKADSLNTVLSGIGNIEVSGEVSQARIDIPGAGSINFGDLKIETADVTISGIGSASIWVTNQLTGNISGGGNVRYYGDPQTDVGSSGLGQFESLGSK
jgi:hypothetical protein